MYNKLIVKILSVTALFLAIFLFIRGVGIYNKAYRANIRTPKGKPVIIYIPTGSTYQEVLNILTSGVTVKNMKTLEWTAERKNYKRHIKPGRYKIKNRTSNNELINKLRAGSQEPVTLTFNNIRFPKELAKKISKQLEPDFYAFDSLFNNKEYIGSFDFNEYTFACMFIPNSYEFYWNTTADEFVKRMHKEYEKFWNEKRTKKAEQIGLTPVEVSILASIVDQETFKNDEKSRIAGVYINRLNRNIRLHADPTVKFAVGNFNIKRILKKHLAVNSPYNTYKHGGLPPGPICYPSVAGIDAVLNYEKHKYLYFCAKEDFSGYHNFATNLTDHNKNAARYRQALNKKRIYR